jgi:HEAT repeat protein
MHPAKVSVAETAHYLIEIGPPTLDSIGNAQQGLGGVKPMVDYLRRNIPPVPASRPNYAVLQKDLTDPEQKMLVRWASRELVSDHPYSYNPLYGRRTLSLGAEAVSALVACAQSKHSLLRENATGILATYTSREEVVLNVLRDRMKGKDPVARNRAISGLVRLGDLETEKFLVKALSGRDKYFRVFAVDALGRMRSLKARDKLRSYAKRSYKDKGDTWRAIALALSRLGDADGKTRKLLKGMRTRVLKSARNLQHGPVGFPPDVPDQPNDRALLIAQTCTLGMARLGDRGARRNVIDWVKNPPDPGAAGGRFRRAALDPVLGSIERMNQFLAIDALASIGAEGPELLENVVKDSKDLVLRGYALQNLIRIGADKFVAQIAKDSKRASVLRVQAMKGLARREPTRADAVEAAETMVTSYLKSPGVSRGGVAARVTERVPPYECLSAVKVLGEHGSPKVKTLLAVLELALKSGHYERLSKEKTANVQRGPGQVNKVSLRAFPALYETVIIELGRLQDPRALDALYSILDKKTGVGHVEAVLALGRFKTQGSVATLLESLRKRDQWLRYSACRSLREISGERHFVDWLFGDDLEREDGVRVWTSWREGQGTKLPTDASLLAKLKEKEEAKKSDKDEKSEKDEKSDKDAQPPEKRKFE